VVGPIGHIGPILLCVWGLLWLNNAPAKDLTKRKAENEWQ